MDDPFTMKVADSKDDLIDDELDIVFTKRLTELLQSAAVYEWHDEEDVHIGLEAVVHATQKRVV